MSISAIITLSITSAGFIGSVVTALVKLGTKTGRILERMDNNEKRDAEERAKTSATITALTERMNATEGEVKAQGTAIKNILDTCTRIENKLDRRIEREAK